MIWNPLIDNLKSGIENNEGAVLLICPFVTLPAIKELFDSRRNFQDLKIITRWNEGDVLTRVSDIEIYPYLKEKGIKLFINTLLHVKLIIFKNNSAYLMTGNITGKGLGLTDDMNIEAGVVTEINSIDWKMIFKIIESSNEVGDEMYKIYQKYIDENRIKQEELPEIVMLDTFDKTHSISSLPVIEDPEKLYKNYEKINEIKNKDEYRKTLHDLSIYNIPLGLDKVIFFNKLSEAFINHPFIVDLIDFLKSENQAIRFGKLKKWLQDNCSNKPVPYMFELTMNAKVFYKWLPFFFGKKIKITQPRHSQLIEWINN